MQDFLDFLPLSLPLWVLAGPDLALNGSVEGFFEARPTVTKPKVTGSNPVRRVDAIRYRLCFLRVPEGLIIGLAEQLG